MDRQPLQFLGLLVFWSNEPGSPSATLAVAAVGQLPGVAVETVDGNALLGDDGDVEEGLGPHGGGSEQRGGDGDKKARQVLLSCGGDVLIV